MALLADRKARKKEGRLGREELTKTNTLENIATRSRVEAMFKAVSSDPNVFPCRTYHTLEKGEKEMCLGLPRFSFSHFPWTTLNEQEGRGM